VSCKSSASHAATSNTSLGRPRAADVPASHEPGGPAAAAAAARCPRVLEQAEIGWCRSRLHFRRILWAADPSPVPSTGEVEVVGAARSTNVHSIVAASGASGDGTGSPSRPIFGFAASEQPRFSSTLLPSATRRLPADPHFRDPTKRRA
jgi:hypothetical protein